MSKQNKNEEIEKLKQVLMDKIKSENDSRYRDLSSDEIMKIIINSSNKGKYVFWVLGEYLKGNIQRFEDMSRVKQALILFGNNLGKFNNSQKQLNKMSFQELETLVSPYQDILTQNAIKRMNKEKIYSETSIIYDGPEGKIVVPLTEESSIFWGKGTKWCTAAINKNMFNNYNKDGHLYIFISNKKDEKGREIKYQLHFESEQFMDAEDEEISVETFEDKEFLNILYNNLSMKEKIKKFLDGSGLFFDMFSDQSDMSDIIGDIAFERFKLYGLEAVEENFITREMCLGAVKSDGSELKFVPYDLLDVEIYETAISQNGICLKYIDNVFKNYELCKMAVRQNGEALLYVPDSFKTQELCEIAFHQNMNSLKFFPRNLLTKELFMKSLEKIPNNILFLPKEMETQEFCEKALKFTGHIFESIPENLRTQELCELALGNDGRNLRFVPKNLVTPELCKLAVRQNGMALQYVPQNFITNELYKIAIETTPSVLEKRYCLQTKEFCKLAAKHPGLSLNHIPTEFVTKEICEIAVKNYGMNLRYVPEKFVTKELCELTVISSKIGLLHTPKEMVTPELCRIAVKNHGFSIRYVPNNIITQELCEIAINQSEDYFDYIPKHMKTKQLCKLVVDKFLSKNNLNYSFEEVVEMIFLLGDNPVKNHFYKNKEAFQKFYIDMFAENTSNKKNAKCKI